MRAAATVRRRSGTGLSYYGAGGMDHEMARLQILSDDGGSPFLSQVSSWVKYKYGLDKLEGLLGNVQIWKSQDEEIKLYQEKEQEEGRELSSLLEGQQQSLPAENNPLDTVEQLKKSSLLSVMPRDRQVSQKRISPSDQPSGRALEQGYGSFDDVAEQGDISRLALGVYLLEHFSSAVPEEGEERESGGGGLDYELEYMISGQPSDMENLEKTVQKLLLIRTVSNFAYIPDGQRKEGRGSGYGGGHVCPPGCTGYRGGSYPGPPLCLVLWGERDRPAGFAERQPGSTCERQ